MAVAARARLAAYTSFCLGVNAQRCALGDTTAAAAQLCRIASGGNCHPRRGAVMPLDFEAHPGLGIEAVRNARGPHPVYATGPAMVLGTMVPAVPPIPQANGSLRFDLAFVDWLVLPVIRPGDDIPGAVALAENVVHPARLGTALERCILGGLDTTACTPSVARARIKRVGMRLYATTPLPFEARMADLYPCLLAPLLGGVAPPLAVPGAAAVALLRWFVAADGTFEPLGDAEPIILPRILFGERVAGCGLDFLFTAALVKAELGLEPTLVAAIPILARAHA